MRRTAVASAMRKSNRPATKEEEKRYKAPLEAIVLFYAALNIAISDVRDELEPAGLYRHATKRELNAAESIILRNFTHLYQRFQTNTELSRRSYDYWMLEVSNAIDECILLTPPKRSYNIAIALTRIITELNDSLGRFVVAEALPLRHALIHLERITGIDDHHIDMILARKLRAMMDEDERRRKAQNNE